MRVTKNKIAVAKSIDHRRRVGQRQKPGGCITLSIEVLMPRVERRREQASLLPFEGLLFCPVVPNRGRAAAFDAIAHLFNHALIVELLHVDVVYDFKATRTYQLHRQARAAAIEPRRVSASTKTLDPLALTGSSPFFLY